MSQELLEKLDLFISAKSLKSNSTFSSKVNSFVALFLANPITKELNNIAILDVIKDSHNPVWQTPFCVPYNFECIQEYVIRIYLYSEGKPLSNFDQHTLLGGAVFNVSSIMRAPNQRSSHALAENKGLIEVHGEVVANTRDNFIVTFSANNLSNKEGFFSKSDPFLIISRLNEDSTWSSIWQNTKIDNTLNPKWSEVKIPMTKLCNGDIDRPLKIEIFDHERSLKHVFMGQVETSVRSMLMSNGIPMPVIEPLVKAKKKNYTNSGTLVASNSSIEHNPTFGDFISNGCEISLVVAIDFTSSNGDPSLPSSLHYLNPAVSFNPYEQAIFSVGSVLQPYDSDNMYPLYGFGAKLRTPDGSFSPAMHCFPLYSGGVEVKGIDGILNAYRECVKNIMFSGPTLFTPIIRTATSIAASKNCSQDNQQYTVLLILTDGVINDFELAKGALIDASYQPLSIIIVGIGNADFSEMYKLDSDDKLLSLNGKTASRDIVQFVALNDLIGKGTNDLAQQVLAEIPAQFLLFMQQHHILPKQKSP